MFEIKNLVHQYKKNTVLDLEYWKAEQGEHCLILGKSGSGKTTLLHILGALLKPTKGEVWVRENPIHQLSSAKLDKFRAKNVAFIFQKHHLVKTLNVLQNLKLAQYMAGFKQDDKVCKEILKELGLEEKIKSKPKQLSEGQAQRVAVARAVLNNPSLILADEPTASLDDVNAIQVANLLKKQAEKYNATLLIATHDQRIKDLFSKKLAL